MRWGQSEADHAKGTAKIVLTDDEREFFFGQFRNVAINDGYNLIENINEEVPGILPYLVRFRFRKDTNRWPCFQIGHGVFTVNQINDGYSWDSFKRTIDQGLDLLDKGHPSRIEGLAINELMLRYRDGYIIDSGTSKLDYLKTVFDIDLKTFKDHFQSNDQFDDEINNVSMGCDININVPPGILIFNLQYGLINGQPGLITDTIVRSDNSSLRDMQKSEILDWVEQAHIIQKYAFKKLLNPAFKRRL